MTTVNLYDILNLQQDCTTEDIKKSYKKLAKKNHPDRGGDPEMYQLITDAYNILANQQSRQEYDELYAASKQSEADHFSLRSQLENFVKAQELETKNTKKSTKELLEEQQKEFAKAFNELDKKHNYKRVIDEHTIASNKVKRLTKDLETVRQQDDIENMHEEIFDNGVFSKDMFNAAFDAMYKTHNELIPHNGNPEPWNTTQNIDAGFSTIDNYENLYVENDNAYSSAYSSIKLDDRSKNVKVTKKDMKNIKPVDYTSAHNLREQDYQKSLQEKIREREVYTKKLNDRKFEDFNKDQTCGGYGILNNINTNTHNIATIEKPDGFNKITK